MTNPWTETGDAEEAAQGSGIRLTLPIQEALPVHGDSPIQFFKYRWTKGSIEALYESVNDEMRLRVSSDTAGEALTGDYNTYSQSWDENYKGLVVHCKGNGENINSAWFDSGDLHYAVLFNTGMEGNGLTVNEMGSLLMGMQASKVTDAVPTPTAALPVVTAQPTDETVEDGGSCLYIATADNAEQLVWHFVSPDGTTDVAYDAIGQYFPTLGYAGETSEYLTLFDIPYEFNGWRSYCQFRNSAGSTNSGYAVTYVLQPSPTPTEAPMAPETVSGDNPYAGTYVENVAGRGVISISGDVNYSYVTVSWSSSANETAEWTFSGVFNGRGVLEYSNCLKTVTTYDENGEGYPVLDYNYGTGYIQIDDYGLTWSDDQENIADGAYFERQ